MRYEPSLDGLRAVAVIAVMAFHARIDFAYGGFLGVDVFFVLSGFLITRSLIESFQGTGELAVGSFYMRRLQRLYPALLLMLCTYVAIAPWLFGTGQRHALDGLIAALYLSDYGMAFWQSPWLIQHTWSLSVEEHFYLAWPLVLWLLTRLPQKFWAPAAVVLFLAATLWRWQILTTPGSWHEAYYRFDTRLSGLLLGSAAALALPRAPRGLAVLGCILLLYAMHQAVVNKSAALTRWMLLAEVASLMLIVGAQQLRLLSATPLVWLGKLSYGLYLWHYPVMLWLRYEKITGWPAFAIGGGIALGCATVSYATVERRWRRNKTKPVMGQIGRASCRERV
mgnify:FL=1